MYYVVPSTHVLCTFRVSPLGWLFSAYSYLSGCRNAPSPLFFLFSFVGNKRRRAPTTIKNKSKGRTGMMKEGKDGRERKGKDSVRCD